MLSGQDKEQFKYQVPLPGWGEEGQERLSNATVVIVGVGGLGSHSALSLARAGVGKFFLIDPDYVESSNLPRQNFTFDQGINMFSKIKSIADEIVKINPSALVTKCQYLLTSKNIDEFLDADIFLDGVDNWEARYVINDFCKEHGIPWVHAAASGVRGNVLSFLPKTENGQTPWEKEGISTLCLREFFGNEPKKRKKNNNKSTPGILSPLLPVIANLQVIEALKILVHNYEAVCKEFLTFNGWDMQWRPVIVEEK